MNIILFDNGKIIVDGKNLNMNETDIKQNIGYVGYFFIAEYTLLFNGNVRSIKKYFKYI